MNKYQYFDPCDRIQFAENTIPLLDAYGLWYEIRETSKCGWQVYVPMLVNGRTHHFVNVSIMGADVLGAKYLGKQSNEHVTFREAIAMLLELHQLYARLESRVLVGDWRNSDEYQVLSKDVTDAELVLLVLSRD